MMTRFEKRPTEHNIHCFVDLFSKRDPQNIRDDGIIGKESHKTQQSFLSFPKETYKKEGMLATLEKRPTKQGIFGYWQKRSDIWLVANTQNPLICITLQRTVTHCNALQHTGQKI